MSAPVSSLLTITITIAVSCLLLRQVFVLAAVVRTGRFLSRQHERERAGLAAAPRFFVVVPVLRETAVLADAVTHLSRLIEGLDAQLVIVTTERELAERAPGAAEADTIALVEKLATEHAFLHLHAPDAAGLKSDQLNFAARQLADMTDRPTSATWLVCYDADSRPPVNSLHDFAAAIEHSPRASVFHQSSRFELRITGRAPASGLSRALCDGGALRANRFVTGYELPRLLNRTGAVGPLKRMLSSFVYAHVTTHGVCLRLSLVRQLPFPARSPLEDMHYSFYLGSRDMPMVALRSLDRAEVPDTVSAQIEQASRWFVGPARFARYLKDPATRSGWRARLLALSAFGSAVEWLGCAVVPPAVLVILTFGEAVPRIIAAVLTVLYIAQLVLTEHHLGTPDGWPRRLLRVVACPAATVLFGMGGFIGALHLLKGGSGAGKTERTAPA
ncbi:hypothetical protein HII36_40030 [Nonomuraea sp. NN258]|uniref:glycosyltransferase n=1 Tax=Nonomuraea antri TaxID=2730852 RepID=UPI001568F384|nr:glycosyltransferase family 2 protein [Nonomuraea antri]NRQ37977.1 hypothetical protein [Nonomuraea antri]